jgi:two-component system LytT family response regulator
MSIRVVIIDDERLARVALKQLLDEHGGVEIVGQADSVATGRVLLSTQAADVVFLDIQLGDGSGFELIPAQAPWRVVFCTAWEQFAVRAFEVNALDYLVKPVMPEALQRALSRLGTPRAPVGLRDEDAVMLREAQAMRLVPLAAIEAITAADDYTEIHILEQPTALVEVTLKEWESRLALTTFTRIHRSTLVNMRHVTTLRQHGSQWAVGMRSGQRHEVSRRLVSDVRKKMEIGAR